MIANLLLDSAAMECDSSWLPKDGSKANEVIKSSSRWSRMLPFSEKQLQIFHRIL